SCAVSGERLTIAAAIDSDHQAETPSSSCLYSDSCILDERAARRRYIECPGTLEECIRVRLALEPSCIEIVPVDARIEQRLDAGDAHDLPAVTARGHDPGAHPAVAQGAHERERRLVDSSAVAAERLPEQR